MRGVQEEAIGKGVGAAYSAMTPRTHVKVMAGKSAATC